MTLGTVANMAAALRAGDCTAVDLLEEALSRARSRSLGIFVATCDDSARSAAAAADRELRAGRSRGPLHGIPVAVKDVVDVAGAWTRCGTPGLGHRLATRDAAVVSRLRAAGAIILGKTATHELAWGMVTPGCRNPRDPDRITGGSSGGSAAAVAAGIVPLAIGTDTGGSVRNPAALCGVAGLKTAVGAIPLDGIAPLARTQDCVGLLGATVADCATGFAVLTGQDNPAPPRLRVGVVTDRWAGRVSEPVAAAISASREALAAAGVPVVAVSVPFADLAPAASYVVMLAESAAHWWPLARQDPGSVSRPVHDILELGSRVTAMDYLRALRVREALRRSTLEVLADVDALLLPACPVTAVPVSQDYAECVGRREPLDSAHSRLTALASVTGLAAISVPGQPSGDGLPTGVQFVGRDEATVSALAQSLEDHRVTGK